MTLPVRNSAKAIIIRNGKMLLTRNKGWRGDDYYLLPGGGQEHGERLDQTLVRECLEETGLIVIPGPLRYVRDYIGKNHAFRERHEKVHQVEYLFICEIAPGQNMADAPVNPANPDEYQTGVVWIELTKLTELQIFPSLLKQLIMPDGRLLGEVYLGDTN